MFAECGLVSSALHGVVSFSSLPPPSMFSLNRIQLIGYQTQPVQIRQTPSGTSVTDLNVVVPVQFKAENGQEIVSKSFHTVTVWGGMADVCGQFVRPGSQVFLAGRLQTDTWDDQTSGEKRSKTKVVATDMVLLDPKSGQMEPPQGMQRTAALCNRADILGNLTRDPEMRSTTTGQKVLSLGVATSDRWKDRATGEMKERTEFHNVVIWGDLAEEVARVASKGSKVYVTGRVQTRSWETQAGAKRTTTEIIAESVSLLGVRSAIAAEAVQSDLQSAQASAQSQAAPTAPTEQDVFGSDPAPVMASASGVQYESDIKVEDLPF